MWRQCSFSMAKVVLIYSVSQTRRYCSGKITRKRCCDPEPMLRDRFRYIVLIFLRTMADNRARSCLDKGAVWETDWC
jgi:hypothetical protein